jgi:hypothetical protein
MSDHLGGRVGNNEKVGFSGTPYVNDGVTVKNSGTVGTGGYRMYFNQYTYRLGLELAKLGQTGQLTFRSQNSFSRISGVENRGFNASLGEDRYFTYNNGGVAKPFAPLYHSPINDNDFWKVLLCGPQVPVNGNDVPQYQEMDIPGLGNMTAADYLEWVADNVISPGNGPEVAQYFLDTWRFRGDFDPGNDAVSYLDYNAKDFTGGLVIYPIPSFQPYFEIMQAQILAKGGRVYLNEKVLSVNSQSSGPRYKLVTSKNTVTANSVIIATTHKALGPGGITGNVIGAITAQPHFQYVQAVNAVTVTHQFGDGANPNTGWWHGDITYPTGSQLLGPQLSPTANPIRRTTNNFMIPGEDLGGGNDFTDTLFFNNTNELPLTDYHDHINTARSVYNDQTEAVENWIALHDAGGDAAVNRQILKSLRLMYPKVFTGIPADEPQIRATQFTVHKPAWYILKQGALASGITNDTLFEWSLNPLSGERVYLVGDAWRPDESGWSDAAYKGSVYVLNRYFGAKIDPKEPSKIRCIDGDIVDPD